MKKDISLYDLILGASDDFIKSCLAYLHLEEEKEQFARSFNKLPKFDYLGKKTRIETLNTQKLTAIIDQRLVDFERENRADAKALKDIIKRKEKFPLEKFKLLEKEIDLEIANKVCTNIVFSDFTKYTILCKSNKLSEAIIIINNIFAKGYSVMDILDNYFSTIEYFSLNSL